MEITTHLLVYMAGMLTGIYAYHKIEKDNGK
jgi:hypothetical protein